MHLRTIYGILTLPMLLAGCGEEDPVRRFSAQKFETSPGTDQGAFVVSFSNHGDHRITVYTVEEGASKKVWSGVAGPADQGTGPYVAITTYGSSPEDTEPIRLHILTSTRDQEIIDLPNGDPWINMTSNGGELAGPTVIFDCATFPAGFSGSFPEFNGHWEDLGEFESKSKGSGWRYVVVVAE